MNIKARSQRQGSALPESNLWAPWHSLQGFALSESNLGAPWHSTIVDLVVEFKNWKRVEGSQSTKYYISWEIKSLEVKIPLQTP